VARKRSETIEDDKRVPLDAAPDAPLIDRTTFVPYLINQITNLMNVPFKRDLKKNRMSYAHWTVLAFLAQNGPQSLNEIAWGTVIDQPSLSRIIDQMVERNLVVRRPREDDGRFVSISMTSFGRQRFLELSKVSFAHGDAVVEGIPPDELRQMSATLLKILRHLEATRQR
jgi:DNA-binding MarR family transcriptional regulator